MKSKNKPLPYNKFAIALTFLLVILVNGCTFPIIHFNTDNSVDLGVLIQVITVYVAFVTQKMAGRLEGTIFHFWSITGIALLNIGLVVAGLVGRYFLEYGEVSNTYNFTIANTLFHVIVLPAIATVYAVTEIRKSSCTGDPG